MCLNSVRFRELVKLFCTESSHRKELMTFLSSLIISLNVSDVWSLQTSITNPQPVKRVLARSRSAHHSLSCRSHLLTSPPAPQSWPQLELIGWFPWGEDSRLHYMATFSHLCGDCLNWLILWSQSLKVNRPKLWSLTADYPMVLFVQRLFQT